MTVTVAAVEVAVGAAMAVEVAVRVAVAAAEVAEGAAVTTVVAAVISVSECRLLIPRCLGVLSSGLVCLYPLRGMGSAMPGETLLT